jgi:hypothetical protein
LLFALCLRLSENHTNVEVSKAQIMPHLIAEAARSIDKGWGDRGILFPSLEP